MLALTGLTLAARAGTDDFYDAPDPSPKAAPGTIIRKEPIEAPAGAKAWRVLYVSKAADGRNVAVSGLVVAPATPAPAGERRPIVSWAHGTTGIADACAPSKRDGAASMLPYIDDFIAAGYVVAATDYEGLGTAGVHPYLVGVSEGRNVLDAARAARRIRATDAGRYVVVFGHSQGGHAALFAGELAERYAPDLSLQGVVAGAPAADVATIVPGASRVPFAAGFYVLATKGFEAAYPDDVDAARLLSPAALEAAAIAEEACVIDVLRHFADLGQPITATDPTEDAAFMEHLRASSAGSRPAGAPVLVIQGTADTIVAKRLTDAFVEQACAIGDVVDYRTYEGAGHVDVVRVAQPDVLSFVATRFAGDALADTCPS